MCFDVQIPHRRAGELECPPAEPRGLRPRRQRREEAGRPEVLMDVRRRHRPDLLTSALLASAEPLDTSPRARNAPANGLCDRGSRGSKRMSVRLAAAPG